MSEELYHEVIGSGPVIAFIPGIAATTRYFHDRVLPLAACHQLVLVDPLGFGRSPKPWTTYSIDRHLAELRRVFAKFETLTLVGHSLGARMAVAYAARFPDQVSRLLLLSLPYFGPGDDGGSGALAYFRSRGSGYRALWTNPIVAALTCVISRRLFGWLLPHFAGDLPADVVEDSMTHTWRSSTSTLWEVLYRHDISTDVARLRTGLPVTLVHGDRDASAPVEHVRALAAAHPSWILVELSGCDHNPMLRHSVEVCGIIDARCPPRTK